MCIVLLGFFQHLSDHFFVIMLTNELVNVGYGLLLGLLFELSEGHVLDQTIIFYVENFWPLFQAVDVIDVFVS